MNRTTVACVLLPLLLLIGASEGGARTLHVAPPPLGSDGNPGTAVAPWATLQHAADRVAAGDTVIVHAGDYVGMYLDTSGTAAEPITFRGAPGEAMPRVVADNPVTIDGINIEGADHVVIEGFRVDGRTRAGIRAVLCSHVTLRGNQMDGNGRWGILTGFCDDLLIEYNVATGSIAEHGIYVSNSGDRPIVRGNLLANNRANGLHMNGDVSLGGDGVISGALVEDNVIFDNGVGGGSAINGDGVVDAIIRNNLIYAAHASGVSLYRIDGGQPSTGNRVLNNTIIVASDGRWGINIQDASSGNTVKNNIVFSRHGFRGAMSVCAACLPGFVSDYNVVEDRFTTDDGNSVLTLAQWRVATGQDANSRVLGNEPALDALFVDAASGNFQLVPGLGIDTGTPLAEVTVDIEGVARPQGGGWDAGCYERVEPPTEERIFDDGFEVRLTP